MSEEQIAEGIIIALPIATLGITILALFILNRRGGPQNKTKIERAKPKWQKWGMFFLKELLLEIISLVWAIYGIVQLETRDYSPFDMSDLRIAFYIFLVLKYIIIVLHILENELLFQERIETIVRAVTNTGWVPSNWLDILAAWIFIPAIMIDGIIIDVDSQRNDTGDFFPYDNVVLMIVDTLIFTKDSIFDIIKSYSYVGRYKVMSIFYALVELLYILILIFSFVTIMLQHVYFAANIVLTPEMIHCIVLCVIHPVICRFTSMCRQGIKATSSSIQLREAPKVRVNALRFYIRWFQWHPIPILLSLAIYCALGYMYCSIYWIAYNVFQSPQGLRPEPFLRGCLVAICILSLIWTVFYMINLAFALLKRLGVIIEKICGCHFPVDCTSYAKAMNRSLSDCGASFLMDSHMQCA